MCSIQVIMVNKIKILQEEEEDRNPPKQHDVEESSFEQHFTSSDNEDKITTSHLSFNIPKIKLSIQETKLRNQVCSFGFKLNCMKALIGSGATCHVTGHEHLLRCTTPESRVPLSGALEEV
eukprot:snap_masked-scaffold_9-processed-gene-11.51-mRNA-1 protein AED:1.00 eAED:1.00 QI:0/-1/0/0/-1/1/1/0/120